MSEFKSAFKRNWRKRKTFNLLDPQRAPKSSLLSEKPAPKKFRLYLDAEVLLGRLPLSRKPIEIAFDATNAMHFLTSMMDCYWLTECCRSDSNPAPVLEYIGRHFSNRPDLEILLMKVRPRAFATPRTDVFAGTSNFFWLTPEITREEEEFLEAYSLFNNWIQVDTKKDPYALAKARDFLREELGRDV